MHGLNWKSGRVLSRNWRREDEMVLACKNVSTMLEINTQNVVLSWEVGEHTYTHLHIQSRRRMF